MWAGGALLDRSSSAGDAVGMAVSGTVPSQRPAGFDPARPVRWLRRATWILALLATALFLSWYGPQRVPRGMNTVASMPPGSLCIVDRRQGAAKIGSHVFVDVPEIGILLSRVVGLDASTITVENPDPASSWPDSRNFGPLPLRCLRSTVLVVFPFDASGAGDGK